MAVTLLALYVVVALLNYSVVQSVAGSIVGKRLSAAWGGEVKIGSIHVDPWNHLVANNLLMVSPDNDTILDAELLRVSFSKFPYRDNSLTLRRVYLKNAYYHLASYSKDDPNAPDYVRNAADTTRPVATNLQYILNHYYRGPRVLTGKVYTVDVGTLILNRVHYRMDLPDHRKVVYDYGVETPHMEFFDINGKVTKIHVANDDVTCRLVRLSALERSGFALKDIAAQVHVGPSDITVRNFKAETEQSVIRADLAMTYNGWLSMKDYVHNVHHDITIAEGTSVALTDVAYWAPAIWGVDMRLAPEGRLCGTVDSIATDDFRLDLGHASEVALEGCVELDLADKKVDLKHADLDRMDVRFEQSDLQQMVAMMPQWITPTVAKYLHDIEYIDLASQLHGSLREESTINMSLVCGLGNLRADAKMQPTATGRRLMLHADSDGMGLTLIGSDWMTHSGFNINADADLPNNLKNIKDIDAEAFAALTGSVVKGNSLNPIDLHAYMKNGRLEFSGTCTDSLLYVDMHGNAKLGDSIPCYYAHIDLTQFQADKFGLTSPEFGRISTHIEANMKGNDLDGMRGAVALTGTKVGDIRIDETTLSVTGDHDLKNIHLTSDAVDATVTGRFAYADLPLMLQNTCYTVLPADLQLVAKPDSTALAATNGNTMNFHMRWNDNGKLLGKLAPKIRVAQGTRIDGAYNNSDLLRLVARCDSVRIGDILIEGIGLNSRLEQDSYRVELESYELATGGPLTLSNVTADITSSREGADVKLTWGEKGGVSDSDETALADAGDLWLRLKDGDISVVKPWLAIGGRRWKLGIDSMHLATVPRTTLTGEGITLASGEQRIDGRVQLRGAESDCVELTLENLGLGLVTDLMQSPIAVDGDASGRFSLYGLGSTPYFNANLTVDSCFVGRQELGELTVRSNWNAELNTLSLLVSGNTLNATGWIGLGDKDQDLNLAVDFNRFELASVAPLLATFSSRFEGRLEGGLDISGTLKAPIVVGEAYVDGGALKVDATGVTYYFNDSLQFSNNKITLDRFRLLDQLGNMATVSGTISYPSLDDLRIDLNLATDNLLVLDQRSGDSFYGTALVGAQGSVRGNAEKLDINIRARTNPGSALTIPVSDRRQVSTQDYITFVGGEESVSSKDQRTFGKDAGEKRMGLNIEMDLTVTPDVQLNLPMDFSEVNVTVKGSGNGDLHLSLDERMEPDVKGSYEIGSGTMKLALMGLLEKNFTIEQGSELGFQGSLPDARFDIKAVYSQRVNLSTLTGSLSAVDNTQKNIQVENVIAVEGTLNEPTLSFDLRLPSADASIEEEVFAYIDRNSERDMLNQTISLLLLGQFYNATGNSMTEGGDLLSSGLSSGYSMVASTMGSMVSDMVQVVDVDFKYKAATEMTNEQVDLNISKDWGRWYLESTLGYGGDSRELEGNANGNAVIDALLGYRINQLVHLYAYNRTNNNDYTRIDLPYKQGAGLKLTKEFDRWSDLFRRKSKRK